MSEPLPADDHPGISEGLLAALREARAVGLARHHGSPATLVVNDTGIDTPFLLAFEPPSRAMRAAWADRDRTTEWAAEAIALEVVHAQRGLGAIQRAARGTRFDWYVGTRGADLEACVALEVGGTDIGRPEVVLREKLDQLRARAAALPGLAVAVQLSTPRAMLRDA